MGDAKEHNRVQVAPHRPFAAVAERLHTGGGIGMGGMSVVLEARDTNLERVVAMKALRTGLSRDEDAVRRLVEEAQITAQLDHPHVVPVYEVGEDEQGTVFFTMKRVRGRTLTQVLLAVDPHQREGSTLFDELFVFLKVCDAVAFAHSRGVIHRDLKPDNVMVGEFGEVYVMDWGIARLKDQERPSGRDREPPAIKVDQAVTAARTAAGLVVGTPGYMSPEHATGKAVDERSDVFSLGGILYEILTQSPPYTGQSAAEVVQKAARCEVLEPAQAVDFDVPAPLAVIAMRAMRPDPLARYQTVSELRGAVEGFLRSGWRFATRDYPPGALILREKDEADAAYIITRGRCRAFRTVDGRKIELREMEAGKVFGETALFSGKPRAASVEAIDAVTVKVVTRAYIESELRNGSWLGVFIRAQAERFLDVDAKAGRLELEHEAEQVRAVAARCMCFLGEPDGKRRVMKWSALRQKLCALTNLGAEVVTRAFARGGAFTLDLIKDSLWLDRP